MLLKIYIYGYLNRVQSSRRLERECQRNVELMWLSGRLAPDFKTIADFRRDNGPGIRNVCSQFVSPPPLADMASPVQQLDDPLWCGSRADVRCSGLGGWQQRLRAAPGKA